MKKGLLISIIALLITIFIFIYTLEKYNNKKSFKKPEFDTSAITGIPTVDDSLDYKELDAEGLYSVVLCGTPTIENNKLKIYLTSQSDNNVYLKARIFKSDKFVGESGLIKPGEYVENINVKNVQSHDNITIKIMGYEIDTYYSAGAINVDLKVR